MDKITKALHERLNIKTTDPVTTPVFQSSAFQSTSPYFYTRKNNPNIEEFEQVLCSLEETKYAIATTTGMSAIFLTLSLLDVNSTLVINKDIYGCSYKLFQKYAKRLGINLVILDLSIDKYIDEIPAETKILFFETPTNPFLKTINIKKVKDHVKKTCRECLIVVDNTWATPLYQQPLKHGADISLHSATKYFSGHSDVMGGCILTDNKDIYEHLVEERFYNGNILQPFDAWLLRRSLQTLDIRLKQHEITTREIKGFLEGRGEVEKVYYPAIDGNQLTGYGTLLFFDLREDLVEHYDKFTNGLKLFDTGTGMACVTSMVAQPFTGSHASMTDNEKNSMGLNKALIRLSLGLENADDLKEDLTHAFNTISVKS